ncbi:MAG: efflux transporter outer membrane subunit [Burkholderiales bacterium]
MTRVPVAPPVPSRRLALAAVALALAGCVAGPDYVKPQVEVPARWSTDPGWVEGRPADDAPKGPWWERFRDPVLSELQRRALEASPTIALANARVAQSRAVLAGASASLFPQIGLSERVVRQKISANRPLTNYNVRNFSTVQNDFAVSMAVNYEVDLAGRIERSIEGASASAEQAAADAENLKLVLSSDIATAYFNLRAADAELDVVTRAIALQQRALDLVRARHQLGAGSGLEVAQQQALLDSTKVQLDLLRRQRGLFEHAIATLVGTPAPSFELAADVREIEPPLTPPGVPSQVLERRPDVASAERAMAAANAQIGVASAAFYPSLVLGAAYGVDSRLLPALIDAPSVLWSFGATAAQVLFDGGRLKANVEIARQQHAVVVANYRRVVLQAMQEVEDALTGMASLERASAQAQIAVTSARRVLQMASARYEGGASAFLDVIAAQQALLTAERQATQLRGQRLLTSVFLVKALGGDWRPAPAAAR